MYGYYWYWFDHHGRCSGNEGFWKLREADGLLLFAREKYTLLYEKYIQEETFMTTAMELISGFAAFGAVVVFSVALFGFMMYLLKD